MQSGVLGWRDCCVVLLRNMIMYKKTKGRYDTMKNVMLYSGRAIAVLLSAPGFPFFGWRRKMLLVLI